jgi:alkaline phosphatase
MNTEESPSIPLYNTRLSDNLLSLDGWVMTMHTRLSNSILRFFIVAMLAAFSNGCAGTQPLDNHDRASDEPDCGHVRNIIVMIPDGCDAGIQTLTRWFAKYTDDYDLMLDEMLSGGMKTWMANSVTTGSAAAASAFSGGHKTTVRFLGMGPRRGDLLDNVTPTVDPYVPFATVLEANKLLGKSVGLVATSRISHATPAAYAAHVQNRNWDNDIMEQLVYQDLDIVFGGGERHLLPGPPCGNAVPGGKRSDCENLRDVLRARGVDYATDREGLQRLTSMPAWGMFASSHMAPDMDNQHFDLQQPTLAEMTAKAIKLLSENQRGFFLMVEGSQVDWAGHANDPIYMLTEFLAFDKAVRVAVDFAKMNNDTLVVAFPDHNTGGLTIGNYATHFARGYGHPWTSDDRAHYTDKTVEDLLSPLAGMRITSYSLAGLVEQAVMAADACDAACVQEKISEAVAAYWSIDITPEQAKEIRLLQDVRTGDNEKMGLAHAISEIISRDHTLLGWTTHGHTGDDVPLWTYGKDRLIGLYDNTEIAREIACRSRCDLEYVSKNLFVPVTTVFPGAATDATDPENLMLKIANAELYEGKDVLKIDEKVFRFEGIVVYAPEPAAENWFIPQAAVTLINKHADF